MVKDSTPNQGDGDSLNRKDVDFAKKLDQALKATEREVWVDWEDILPGVEGFSDEIQRGLEGTNALVAILSPSYLESEYCLMELRDPRCAGKI